MNADRTYHVTVTVSPTLQTVCAVGFVMGGDTASRRVIASGVASAVVARARRTDTTFMRAGSIAGYSVLWPNEPYVALGSGASRSRES